jgi:putative transposase
MKKRFGEEQIIGILKEADAGKKVLDICREHGISDATYYTWRKKYAGMTVAELRRLKELERENARLKKIVAQQAMDNDSLKELLSKKW